ncbi:hypothetical protein ACSLO2_27300, partial [Escherichia coli]
MEKFKKYNFQKYPFVFTDVNYKNLINWNDLNKLLEKSVSKAVTSNETKIKDAIALFTASTEESLKKHREGVKEAM